jgi:flavin-dependent dehydrogenase
MLAAGHPHKHGVVVFGPRGKGDWWVPMTQRKSDGELVEQFTWQVRRSVFDTMMLEEATSRGADLLKGRAVEPLVSDDGSAVVGVRVQQGDGSTVDIRARVTIDCTGQASFLANNKVTGPKYLGSYDKQIAIFSQVANYVRSSGTTRDQQPGNTHIFYKQKYQWAWAIPLDDEITSVGVVVPAEYFRDKKESKADFLRREFKELNPGLAERIPDLDLVEPPHVIPNYSFQVQDFAGPGYLCIGDAHRFVDPIFSFGLYVSIREAGMAAQAVSQYLSGELRGSPNPFHDHMVAVEYGIDVLEDMIDTFWENPLAFAVFVHSRFRGPMIDVFSGRIYEGMPNDNRDAALVSFRKLLKRERTYDDAGLFSVPVGSRFHPERAPLWNDNLTDVETTERWIVDQGLQDLEA